MAHGGGDGEEGRRIFARQVLDAVRGGRFVRQQDVAEEINDYAERVRDRFDELTELFDERGLEFLETSTEAAEGLVETLKELMENREYARIGGLSGNALRLGGTLAYAHPVGQVAFWGGFVLSSFSDFFASTKTKEIEDLAGRINRIFQNDRERFTRLARAIQRLDEAIQRNTGWSLYDDGFHEFLRAAAENPADPAITIPQDIVVHRGAIMDLAQNRSIIQLLQHVVRGVQREDLGILNVLTMGFQAASHLQDTPREAAAFQLGELAIRGLVIYVEYKQNRKTLEDFRNGVQRMRREYQALYRIYGPAPGAPTPDENPTP